MWALWFIPLIAAIFICVLIFAIGYAAFAKPKKVRTWFGLAAAPFGCAAMPILAVMLLGAAAALFQKSDRGLFDEIYGFNPEMREDQMLSDDLGPWSNRSIYMRLEATPRDRQRILDVADRSNLTVEQFANHGTAKGFSWWNIACDKPSIYESNGYREWQTLMVYDCPERQIMFVVAFRP